jgi:exoribonuclease R
VPLVPSGRLRISIADGESLRAGFADIRRELRVPRGFSSDVLVEAERAAKAPRLPAHDATDLPLVTIDPWGARDLDQALHIERRGAGYRVWYAIADLAAFVVPGGAVDREAHQRGETLYWPDQRIPLHPPVLSEDAASLLPGRVRPALLWTFDLDASAKQVAVNVRRAKVRSRAQLDYQGAQRVLELGRADEPLALLAEVGALREEREQERGGAQLRIPEQEVVETPSGYTLKFRAAVPLERWNAQLSFLTGMAAAQFMLHGNVGVLRTLPPASEQVVARLRRLALALGVTWPAHMRWADLVRGLDRRRATHAALLEETARLLGAASYTAFDGALPEQTTHAALAAEYAHVTAPLRRLVDRYAGEVCVALSNGTEVPDWARARLAELPSEMASVRRLRSTAERAVLDLVEAVLLRDRVGEVFDAVVVEADGSAGQILLRDPPVRAPCSGSGLAAGDPVRARLVEADPIRRAVRFEAVSPAAT